MLREAMLMKLPDFRDKWELVKKNQSVKDIMNQIFLSHDENESSYDKIANDFVGGTDVETFENLFNFLKEFVPYDEEPEEEQVIKSPAAIIETARGDCKTYASFIGGVLDALIRRGADIDFCYVFAGYNAGYGHVFIEAISNGAYYWIDPVLAAFNSRTPSPTKVKKFCKDMALYKLSGVEKKSVGNIDQKQDCVIPYESMDQQLVRLTKCSPSINAGTLIPSNSNPTIYDLPTDGQFYQPAPVDALPLNPGMPVTAQDVPVTQEQGTNADNPSNIQTGDNPNPTVIEGEGGVMVWVRKNPVIAAGIAAVILYAVTRKKRRA